VIFASRPNNAGVVARSSSLSSRTPPCSNIFEAFLEKNSQPVGKQTAAYPPYGGCHLELSENSCMDLPTDFDCSVHIQLRFGGNHKKKIVFHLLQGIRKKHLVFVQLTCC
jgi:hypothetical protein